MNLPTAEASNAVVIAKNPAKGQFMVDDIPLAVILTGDPLNNYVENPHAGQHDGRGGRRRDLAGTAQERGGEERHVMDSAMTNDARDDGHTQRAGAMAGRSPRYGTKCPP
jgi:hypothetical protein